MRFSYGEPVFVFVVHQEKEYLVLGVVIGAAFGDGEISYTVKTPRYLLSLGTPIETVWENHEAPESDLCPAVLRDGIYEPA